MKRAYLLLFPLLALLAGCERATDAVAPAAQTTLSATDLRGTWAVAAVAPAAHFTPADSAAIAWVTDLYVDKARVQLLPDGNLRWQFHQVPGLSSERLVDTILTAGTWRLRHVGRATWLDLHDCETDHLRLSLLPDHTLRAEDPQHHIALALRRVAE